MSDLRPCPEAVRDFRSAKPELMSVIFLLITASTFVAGIFLVAFIWAVRHGQFDDDLSPAVRILNDTTIPRPVSKNEGFVPPNETK